MYAKRLAAKIPAGTLPGQTGPIVRYVILREICHPRIIHFVVEVRDSRNEPVIPPEHYVGRSSRRASRERADGLFKNLRAWQDDILAAARDAA